MNDSRNSDESSEMTNQSAVVNYLFQYSQISNYTCKLITTQVDFCKAWFIHKRCYSQNSQGESNDSNFPNSRFTLLSRSELMSRMIEYFKILHPTIVLPKTREWIYVVFAQHGHFLRKKMKYSRFLPVSINIYVQKMW